MPRMLSASRPAFDPTSSTPGWAWPVRRVGCADTWSTSFRASFSSLARHRVQSERPVFQPSTQARRHLEQTIDRLETEPNRSFNSSCRRYANPPPRSIWHTGDICLPGERLIVELSREPGEGRSRARCSSAADRLSDHRVRARPGGQPRGVADVLWKAFDMARRTQQRPGSSAAGSC